MHVCAVQHNTSEEETEVAPEEVEVKAEEAVPSSDSLVAPPSTSNGVAEVKTDTPAAMSRPSDVETTLESPIAQPEELCLPNGLPLPLPQDPDVPTTSTAVCDDSPIAEPDVIQDSVEQTPSAAAETVPTPAPIETTVQGQTTP